MRVWGGWYVINIGFVSTWFERGAAYVTRSYIDLLKDNHNIFVYARGGEHYAKEDPKWNLPYVTWGKRVGFSTEIDIKHFISWIKKNKIDIVFFNEQHDITPVLEIKLKCSEIKIGSYIDYYKLNTVPDFSFYDFLICNTKRHYKVFSWHPQCYYIKWGTNIKTYKPISKPSRKKIVFFHSQGMSLRKGTEILVNTFIKHKLYKYSKLIVHTQIGIEPFKDKIVKSLNLLSEFNVEIIKKTVSAPGLYYLGDVYVYPTKLEGLGLTIYEALASGLPVITTDDAPMNEIVDNEIGKLVKVVERISRDDGYYWPLSIVSEEDLAEKMFYYVENYKYIGDFSRRARRYAERNLNWNDRKDIVEKIFSKTQIVNISAEEVFKRLRDEKKRRRKKWIFANFDFLVPNSLKSIIIEAYIERKYKRLTLYKKRNL